MKIQSVILIIIVLPFFTCCANANISKNREAYILSQPHGWIELTLIDSDIPPELPPADLNAEQLEEFKDTPPICYVTVEINNEIFLKEPIFPYGEEPPYAVNTGFRFPVPIGTFHFDFKYSGCNIENNQKKTEEMSTTITIFEKMVTPIIFDGDSYIIKQIEKNTVITLDDIYEKIQ